MKKLIVLLGITICLIIFSTNFVLAESSDVFTYEITEDNEIVITGVTDNTVTEISIPGIIDGKKVTSIGEFAFCDCTNLTKAVMEENIIKVGEAAFAGCAKLVTVDLSDSVEIIGSSAFRGCGLLENITLPSNLKVISDQAFYSCSKIIDIEFPEGLEKIEADAFYDCYNIIAINIPASVTSISDGAFSACMGIKTITVEMENKNYICDEYGVLYNIDKSTLFQHPVASTRTNFVIPDSVCEIGSYAFCGAEYLLGELTVPKGVTFIPKYAFFACARLSNINLHDNITGIDEYAFFACQNLTGMSIPQKTEYIGDRAFASCAKLKTLSLPETLDFIGVQAFSGCSSLLTVTMPCNMKTIGARAFFQCTSLEEIDIPHGVTIIDEELLYGCVNLKRITIPETVVFIAKSALCNCELIEEVTLYDNITNIGDNAFKGCNKLKNVYYTGSETEWNNIKIGTDNFALSNVIYNYVMTKGISLDKISANISVGNSFKLNVIFNPLDATNQDIVWSSSLNSVATVENGVVLAVSAGKATITAKTKDSKYLATCLVTVINEAVDKPVVTSINTVYEMPYTYTDESGLKKTVPSGVAFATVYDQYGNYELKEFGMLLTDKNLDKENFKITTKGIIKGKGETKPNVEGQFGIMFYGNGLEYGKTYYTLSYAIYEDEEGNELTIYGNNVTEFSPKGE